MIFYILFILSILKSYFVPLRKNQTTESINKLLAQITGENNEQLWIFL